MRDEGALEKKTVKFLVQVRRAGSWAPYQPPDTHAAARRAKKYLRGCGWKSTSLRILRITTVVRLEVVEAPREAAKKS